MNDEKLLSVLRRHLDGHSDALRNDTGDEHDILPTLFSVLLENQLALGKTTDQVFEELKKQLTDNHTAQLEKASSLSLESTQHLQEVIGALSKKAELQHHEQKEDIHQLGVTMKIRFDAEESRLKKAMEDNGKHCDLTDNGFKYANDAMKEFRAVIEKKVNYLTFAIGFNIMLGLVLVAKVFMK